MALRYLLDEHMPASLRVQLLRREPTLVVRRMGGPDTPPLGTLDPALLVWCEASGFVLVTNNQKSMPTHLADHLAAGQHIPGILALDPEQNLAQCLDDLVLIALAAESEDYKDRIEYLPL